jgi:class 3 adenylate cyclase
VPAPSQFYPTLVNWIEAVTPLRGPPLSLDLSIAELREFASDCLESAAEAATRRRFPNTVVRYSRPMYMSLTPGLVAEHYAEGSVTDDIPHFDGIQAYAGMLCYDMFKSTELARSLGARDMFVTMHTFQSTLMHVIDHSKGEVVGLRGDGAIAMFGLVPVESDKQLPTEKQNKDMALAAFKAGNAIVKTVDSVVNPLLAEYRIPAQLSVHVGVEIGYVVITRIGGSHFAKQEVTCYGDCVNSSSKVAKRGTSRVALSRKTRLCFKSPQKTPVYPLTFVKHPADPDVYFVDFPKDYPVFKK